MNDEKFPRDDFSRNDLFDNSQPLVLTHQDLNLRNAIVGEGGRFWVVDWGWAGYHPPWLGYVAKNDQ
jgi:thiamine kinase-like enzyme